MNRVFYAFQRMQKLLTMSCPHPSTIILHAEAGFDGLSTSYNTEWEQWAWRRQLWIRTTNSTTNETGWKIRPRCFNYWLCGLNNCYHSYYVLTLLQNTKKNLSINIFSCCNVHTFSRTGRWRTKSQDWKMTELENDRPLYFTVHYKIKYALYKLSFYHIVHSAPPINDVYSRLQFSGN